MGKRFSSGSVFGLRGDLADASGPSSSKPDSACAPGGPDKADKDEDE